MSAIAGVISLRGDQISRELLSKMSALLANRGGGEERVWADGPAGIVQRGMIDEACSSTCSLDAQGIVVAIDGWLDNRQELAAELDITDSISQSNVVRHAYLKWRHECFARIYGDFALVIWDGQQKELLCARDPFAMKPLYYWSDGGSVAVASELPSLLAHPGIGREPDEEAIAERLNWFGFSRTNTLFKRVSRVAPGHVLSASEKGVALTPFWTGAGISQVHSGPEELDEQFRAFISQAVSRRITSSRRVGVRLSGGLDSSTVLATAVEIAGAEAVRAYSVVDAGSAGDESFFIKAAATYCGVKSVIVAPAVLSAEELLASAAQYMDLPDYPSGAQSDSLKQVAQQDGIDLLLTGIGGDDWFFGSTLDYADLIRQGNAAGLIRAFRENRDWSELLESGIAPLVSPGLRRLVKRATGRHKPAAWIHPSLASVVDLYRKSQRAWRLEGFSGYAQCDTVARATNPLETHLIEMEERSEWRYGLVQRHPFFDRRVAEFALSMPQEHKQRQPGKYKLIIRRAMQGRLPPEVLTRTDSPGGVPVIRKMLLHPAIAAMFEKLRIAEFGWVAREEVSHMYRSIKADGDSSPLHVLALWRIVGVESWARVALP